MTQSITKCLKVKENLKQRSTLDKVVSLGTAALALDAIIFPFFTGKTIHEYLGLPPASDYKVWGERTTLQAEQALWSVSVIYQIGKQWYETKDLNAALYNVLGVKW